MTTEIESKVGAKGQVVIPKPIRDEHGLKQGTRVTFSVRDGEVVVRKADEILEEFVSEFEKREEPDKVDWDERHYERV
jgi:AbrB family looped-hinge helix DNA binding protein